MPVRDVRLIDEAFDMLREADRLHRQFMNIAGPTDVLTFPLETTRSGQPISGEVIICLPLARKRAKEHGNSLQNEVLLYAIHGMLHLCGFDDRTDSDFNRMHKKEDAILTRLQQRRCAILLAGMLAPPNLGADYAASFNAIFPDLAKQHGVKLYPFFLDGVAGDASLLQPDGLHPTAKGVAIIVRRIMPALRQTIDQARTTN